MLEGIVLSCIFAVVVSTTVCYLHVWAMRVRIRRLEMGLAEWEERLVKEVKTRAAQASVAARKLNPTDAAILQQHGLPTDDENPWPWMKRQ